MSSRHYNWQGPNTFSRRRTVTRKSLLSGTKEWKTHTRIKQYYKIRRKRNWPTYSRYTTYYKKTCAFEKEVNTFYSVRWLTNVPLILLVRVRLPHPMSSLRIWKERTIQERSEYSILDLSTAQNNPRFLPSSDIYATSYTSSRNTDTFRLFFLFRCGNSTLNP